MSKCIGQIFKLKFSNCDCLRSSGFLNLVRFDFLRNDVSASKVQEVNVFMPQSH